MFASLAVICSQWPFGFILLLVAFPTLVYQGIQCFRSWRSPKQRAVRLTSIMFVIISILVLYGIQVYRNHVVRINSNQIAKTIEKFRVDNNRYPTTLNEVGFDPVNVRHNYRLFYFNNSGNPALMYDSVFTLADYWIYNFSSHQWRYVSP